MSCFCHCSSFAHPSGSVQKWWAPFSGNWSWVTYSSLVIAQFVVEASVTVVIITEMWKTNKHIMCSHLQYVRHVIIFWPVFKQFLNCVIGVDTCLAILFGFSQKQLELHDINSALVLHKGWLVILRRHTACYTGRVLCSPSLEVLSTRAWTTLCVFGVGPGFNQRIRSGDLQRLLANEITACFHDCEHS